MVAPIGLKIGTEMGTNSMVWYAKFVIDFHEKHIMIPKFKINFTFLCHLVYNQFGVVSPDQKTTQHIQSVKNTDKNYMQDINA